MNRERRKQLVAIAKQIDLIAGRLGSIEGGESGKAALQEIALQLDSLKNSIGRHEDDERDAIESLPENMQFSERAEEMEDAACDLSTAVAKLREAIAAIHQAIDV